MKRRSTIHELLANWGRGQRQLPTNNELLKQNILTKFNSTMKIFSTDKQAQSQPRPWLALGLTGLAVITFFVTNPSTNRLLSGRQTVSVGNTNQGSSSVFDLSSQKDGTSYPTAPSRSADEQSLPPSAGSSGGNKDMAGGTYEAGGESMNENGVDLPYSSSPISPDYYPYPVPTPETPITDKREFLKTDYFATLRTRQVKNITEHIQLAVRGFGGRIDSTNISEKHGQISFAMPVATFETFRQEVTSLVGSRFLIERVYTENLLPQKLNIEEQLKQVQKNLTELKADKDELLATHDKTVASLQGQISSTNKELAILQAEKTTDPVRRTEISERIKILQRERSTLNSRLANENSTYKRQLESLDSQIRYAEENKENTTKQDQQVLDTVATVRGTVSVNWISIWDTIGLYLPAYWPSLVVLAAAAIAYIMYRRRLAIVVV